MSEVPLYPQPPASPPAEARVEQGRRKRSRTPSLPSSVQGYLAHKKPPPP